MKKSPECPVKSKKCVRDGVLDIPSLTDSFLSSAGRRGRRPIRIFWNILPFSRKGRPSGRPLRMVQSFDPVVRLPLRLLSPSP